MTNLTELASDLAALRESGVVKALKVETEGEGATWQTIGFLAQFSSLAELPLILKIGGCEARSDIMMSRWLGVAGLTAPMIESPFAASKFLEAMETCTSAHDNPDAYLLVESEVGLANLEGILEVAGDRVDGVNFGRSDLTASLNLSAGGRSVDQDDDQVALRLAAATALVKAVGLRTTVGGRLTEASVGVLRRHCDDTLDRVETKRVVLSWPAVRDDPVVLRSVLSLELALAERLFSVAAIETADRLKMIGELKGRLEVRETLPDFP